ncbi:MAG: hypothetical protein AAFQ84_09605, partial [Pseudomonadota bacterium]
MAKRQTRIVMTTVLSAIASVGLVACGGDDAASPAAPVAPAPPPPPAAPPPPPPPSSSVTISGTVTFESVGVTNPNGLTSTFGWTLDPSDLTQLPARGVIVEAVSATGTVLESTVTNETGAYSVTVDPDTDVRIQAKAQLLQTTGATWSVPVRDNTNGNALYVLAGSLTNSGMSDSVRDLNAPSGSNGFDFTSERTAGPFAIL